MTMHADKTTLVHIFLSKDYWTQCLKNALKNHVNTSSGSRGESAFSNAFWCWSDCNISDDLI